MKRNLRASALAILALIIGLSISAGIASSYGDINITSQIPGTGATNLGKAEDAAHNSTDTGVAVFGVIQPANDTTFAATGDYANITLNDVGNVKVQIEPSRKATYSATSLPVTRAASATTMFVINGSGTKTIKVQELWANYSASTVGVNQFYVEKQSSAPTGGTSTTITSCPLDSNNAAATATVKDFTANKTGGGAAVANIAICAQNTAAGSGAGINVSQTKLFSADNGQPIVLRGTAEGVAITNNGNTVAGTAPIVGFTVKYTEEGFNWMLFVYAGRALLVVFRRRRLTFRNVFNVMEKAA